MRTSLQKLTYIDWEDTIVSGWGSLSSGGSFPEILQWVKVPPVSDATCNQPNSYNGQITANMICAGKTSDNPCEAQIKMFNMLKGSRLGVLIAAKETVEDPW